MHLELSAPRCHIPRHMLEKLPPLFQHLQCKVESAGDPRAST